MSELIRIENLHVAVGDKELLHGISLTVNKGETHVIMGVNGAGKSTLLHAIMGNPAYTVTSGKIYFEGQDITELSVDKRARLGIFFILFSPLSRWQALPWKTLYVPPKQQSAAGSRDCSF